MTAKYETLLSPIQVGNVILKNRMVASNALPHFTQGPETYPSDAIINYLAGIARNGAAIVTFADWSDASLRSFGNGDISHFPVYDISDPATENSLSQLTDAIHFYGSKASLALSLKAPKGYGVYTHDAELPEMFADMMDEMDDMPPVMDKMMKSGKGQKFMLKAISKMPTPKDGKGGPPMISFGPEKELTESQMDEIIEDTLKTLRYYQKCGFDMCTLHMSYRSTLLGKFLSPITNKRTDVYGGSMENRSRFPLKLCRAIKDEFGKDFLIEAQISGEDGRPGGYTVDETITLSKLAEGLIDIIQIRAGDADDAHPTGFNSTEHEPMTLKYSAAIKASGAKIITEPIGGFQNPDDMEQALKDGKADMFGMARAFICDFDFGRKLEEGRGNDITPCIRCNRCHGLHMNGPWLTVCSVNPQMGIENRLNQLVAPAVRSKKVAVIGGGPAGMEAAIVAADRGHCVTLYEKTDALGGQLKHADYASFKWPLKNFKDYLIAQVEKRPIDVRLGVCASQDELKSGEYDVILSSLGAESAVPDIDGAKKENGDIAEGLWNPIEVYGRELELGKKVVVVGGSDIGVETGMYLADCGHEVTVLTRQSQLASASNRVHYYSMMKRYWKTQKGFSSVTRATTKKVSPHSVTYTNKEGKSITLDCDSVIVCGGMKPLKEDALSLVGCAPTVRIIGDNLKADNVQSAIRSAYGAASSI